MPESKQTTVFQKVRGNSDWDTPLYHKDIPPNYSTVYSYTHDRRCLKIKFLAKDLVLHFRQYDYPDYHQYNCSDGL